MIRKRICSRDAAGRSAAPVTQVGDSGMSQNGFDHNSTPRIASPLSILWTFVGSAIKHFATQAPELSGIPVSLWSLRAGPAFVPAEFARSERPEPNRRACGRAQNKSNADRRGSKGLLVPDEETILSRRTNIILFGPFVESGAGPLRRPFRRPQTAASKRQGYLGADPH
jgi:hypothetical protein